MRSLFLLFITFLSACASINNEEVNFKKVSIDDSKDLTLENQFVSEELSTVHLKAFENRAVEKLNDLADYLQIILDKNYDESFRDLAVSQAQKLFIENSEINLNKETIRRVDSFIGALRDSESIISITNIQLEAPLKQSLDLVYEGSLIFTLRNNEEESSIQNKRIEFFLMKTPKAFGTNQKMVWEVFLGDIY